MFTLPFKHSHLHTLREHFSTLIILLPGLCFSVLPPLQNWLQTISQVQCDRDEEQRDARLLVGALADWDIAGSWDVLRQRESKGAQVFQMELDKGTYLCLVKHFADLPTGKM